MSETSVKVTLKKSFKDKDGAVIKELTLKEPSDMIVDSVGFPFVMLDGATDIRPDRCWKYLADMTGIIEPDLKKMSRGDFFLCSMEIIGFFN